MAQSFPNIIKPDWIPTIQAPHNNPDADMDQLSGTVRFWMAEDEQLALETDEQVSNFILTQCKLLISAFSYWRECVIAL